MPTIKGTASVTDDHAMLKQLKKTKFPKSFSQSVNVSKINTPVLSQWAEDKITSILGFEDEIVQSTAINLFFPNTDNDAGTNKTKIDPKRAQLNLVGFLGADEAASFSKELWEMMVDAQTSPHGIPRKLLDKKKEEMEAEANVSASAQQEEERPPEMDEWAKEALRRAEQARQALYGQQRNNPPPAAARAVSPPPQNNEMEKQSSHHHHHHHRRRNNEMKSSRWDRSRGRSRSRSSTPERQRRRSNSSDYDSYSSSSSVDDRRYREEDYRRSKKKSKKKKRKRSSRSRERRRDY